MKGTAIVYTHGLFTTPAAKTAHGLTRGSDRFQVKAIIDPKHGGKDAGELLEGKKRNIPILESISDFLEQGGKAEYLIMGIASAGGKLDPEWFPIIRAGLKQGMSIVSGMHQFLVNVPEFVELAEASGAQLIDVRRPKAREDLHFWSGEIVNVACPKIPVIGTDCAVGKRTTARFLIDECTAKGHNAQMIYTGQTGWMQGGVYGFVLDSTLNDFVSGELEHAILSCYKETNPDIIFIEGQAALRNPSGPCGSELLVSAKADGVVLVHPAGRTYHKGWDHLKWEVASVQSEIDLIKMYGVPTLGIAINTQGLSHEEAVAAKEALATQVDVPVVLPIEEGIEALIPPLEKLIK